MLFRTSLSELFLEKDINFFGNSQETWRASIFDEKMCRYISHSNPAKKKVLN